MYSNYNRKNISCNIGDKKLSISLMSTFVILTIQYFILINFKLLDTPIGSKIQVISKLLVGIVYIFALPVALKRSKDKFLSISLISIIIFLINYVAFIENRVYIKELIFPFFFTCLPSFIYSYSIYDLKIFKNIIKKASFIIFLFGTVLGMMVITGLASIGSYSMSFSNYILIPAIFFLDDVLNKFSLSKLFLFIIMFVIILFVGSRGAILCIIIFLILRLCKKRKRFKIATILVCILITAIVFIFLINIMNILESLNNILLNNGISSRSIQLFLKNEVHLSGRDIIYKNIISAIYKNPIFGVGLAGDRVIIGSYAHNLFLEIIADFGVVLGLLLIFVLLLLVIKSLSTKDFTKYNMIIIWFSIGFVNLMISGSYLTDIKFWIFLGLLIGNIKYRRIN